MGILVFVFFFVAVLILLTINLFKKRDEVYAIELLKLSISAAATVIFFFITMVLLYNNVKFFNIISSKLFLFSSVCVSLFLINTTVKMPYFEIKKRLVIDIINIVGHLVILIPALILVRGFFWDAISGFEFKSYKLFGIHFMDIYISLILFLTPTISIIITIVKLFRERSRIYKQQIVVYLTGQLLTVAIWGVLAYVSSMFSWVISVVPVGYIILIFLTNSAFSLTVVYDKKHIGFTLLRFLSFILVFALAAGILSALVLTDVRNFRIQIVLLVFIAFIFLVARNFVSQKLRWLLGDTAEYAKMIEADLQKIDYEIGREKVLDTFAHIIMTHLKSIGLNILVSNEKDTLIPVYSSFNNKTEYSTKTEAFDYILSKDMSVLMKSQVLTSPEFMEVRTELAGFMTKISAEIAIIVREGQNIIGIIGIAEKRKREEFTAYDFEVLNNLYSYFFLVVYYLKNIAKQDIILTVDREIEMSDQIIGSIQRNMDIVSNKVIDVDSVSYSAHQLGGDFIDFIKLSEDRYFFLIGDVAGKGLSASMSMVILKSVLHTYLSETPDFKELVVKLNVFVKEGLPKGTFFAGLFGIIDFKTTTIYYLNCGIPLMAMYIDSYKNVIEIQGEGRVLGFVKNIRPFLKVRKITMNKNDAIVFTTDGLLDSENLKGDRFGNDRVGRILSANKDKTAKDIADAVYDSLLDFISRDIEDDVTVLAFKHK